MDGWEKAHMRSCEHEERGQKMERKRMRKIGRDINKEREKRPIAEQVVTTNNKRDSMNKWELDGRNK